MSEIIKVGMSDLKICNSPDELTTLGLGSCVGIALWDPNTKVGGLAHVMLPDSSRIKDNSNIYKFADTAIDELVRLIIQAGGKKESIRAKIAGGAQMFAFQNKSDLVCVGQRNVEATIHKLEEINIPLVSQDTGSDFGRTVVFSPADGTFMIRAVGKEAYYI